MNVRCLVCNGHSLEILCHMFSIYCPKIFHKVAICQDCGHIQVYPLFDEKEYAVINETFFDQKYLIDGKQNPDNYKKLRKVEEHLSSNLIDGFNILDVGPGEAWALTYFQEKNCKYFAIEPIHRFASSIQERGGEVIGKSIFDRYPEYEKYFDIVIFRHALEHMLNPIKALSRLKYFLSTDGLIYLALPNAAQPSIKKGFRTSYLRPVHISYFCEGNVLRLAESVHLKSIFTQSSSEIFCLLTHGGNKKFAHDNFYTQQKEIFLKMKRKALFKDIYVVSKFLLSKPLRRR